jgi:hypothetical protein
LHHAATLPVYYNTTEKGEGTSEDENNLKMQ